ncbi:MAG TPA: hypothetical protein PLQ36_04075, partial [Candidatus Gracilibacteria bacterium]|nr:hypothetical protein [Candidatus Gracilibacteria bacterium]
MKKIISVLLLWGIWAFAGIAHAENNPSNADFLRLLVKDLGPLPEGLYPPSYPRLIPCSEFEADKTLTAEIGFLDKNYPTWREGVCLYPISPIMPNSTLKKGVLYSTFYQLREVYFNQSEDYSFYSFDKPEVNYADLDPESELYLDAEREITWVELRQEMQKFKAGFFHNPDYQNLMWLKSADLIN